MPEPKDHQPMTEEQIRATSVGEPPVHNAPIQLAEYDPNWPELFRREEERIRAALGERVVRLEHVGSTAVPGLAAKPIIDMCLVVADSGEEETYVPALEAAGYVLRIREPEWYEHRCFKGPDTNVNLHVYSEGCPEIERYLLFRDRLRTDQADRVLYERTKRELAKREWKYVQNYADAKTEIVEAIIARAQALWIPERPPAWIWSPSENSVQSDLGEALTGAQASLYERARAAGEAAAPLLEGLHPVRPGASLVELGGLRRVVRHELAELVTEFGVSAGPRVPRVNFLFDLLLGEDSSADAPDIGGLLGRLRNRFGLTSDAVNTVEEEQTVTNFLLVADYLRSLRHHWEAARRFFDHSDKSYVGIPSVRVIRALAVVAESVSEIQAALDSVGFGPAERDVIIVELGEEAPLTLGELLSWIGRFADEEGRALVRDGGKVGAEVLASTAARLRTVVRAASSGLRALLETIADELERVERALERLYEEALIVTEEPSPSIEGVFPAQGTNGEQVEVTITGSDFATGADVRLIRSGFPTVWSSDANVVSAAKVNAGLDLSGAAPGGWDVEVLNPLGGSALLPGGFLVLPDKRERG